MSDRPTIAFRYMTRFACLGDKCEDSCCRHWTVTVDESHFVALDRLLRAPADRARFEAGFIPRPESERKPHAFATIRMREHDKSCPFLDPANLCELHRRFGDPALPDVCSFYPRFVSAVGDRLELAGSLSCPEVVRQALLEEDGVELEEADATALGRAPVLQPSRPDDADLLDELRGQLLLALDRPEPLAARLYLLGWIAETAQPFLDEGRSVSALSAELETATSEEVLEELADGFEAEATPDGVRVLVAQVARLRSVVRPGLRDELDRLVDGATDLFERRGEDVTVQPAFAAAWARRRAGLPTETIERLDAWLTRFARHVAFKESVLRPRELTACVRELTVRAATIHFLCAIHPDATAPDALARWLVRLVYGVARVAEHDAEVRAFLALDARELLPSLEALRGLLAFA